MDECRELFVFRGRAVTAMRGDYPNIRHLWQAGGGPDGDMYWMTHLNSERTQRRIASLKAEGLREPVINDADGEVYVHKFLASTYAEELSTDLWKMVRRYLFGEAGGDKAHGVPDRYGSDPIIALRIQQLELEQQVRRHDRAIEGIKETIGRGPREQTTTCYLSDLGVKHTEEYAAMVGLKVRKICEDMGFAIPDKKVCGGGRRSGRMWPIEALDECRRQFPDLFTPRGRNGAGKP